MTQLGRDTALTAFFALLTAAAPAWDDAPAPRTITTAGEAVVYVTPDRATITLAVQTFAAKLDDAKRANRDGGQRVLTALRAAGVDDKQIGTDDVTVSVAYNQNYQPSSGVAGYTARRQYQVKLGDPTKVDAVVEAALNGGANELVGVDYSDSKQRDHRDEARRRAAKAAREKAADLAAQFDAAVGPVRTIKEDAQPSWGYAGSRFSNSAASFGGGAAASDEPNPLPPGQIEIRASITAEFTLQDLPPTTLPAVAK